MQIEKWDFHSHCLKTCTAQFFLSETSSSYVMNFFKLLHKICSLISINEIHFMCFLLKYIFHSDSSDFFKTCVYDKLMLQIMLLAAECQLQWFMFEHHNVFMIQHFINNIMNILNHTSNSALIIDVNIMISLFHNFVMSSDTWFQFQNLIYHHHFFEFRILFRISERAKKKKKSWFWLQLN